MTNEEIKRIALRQSAIDLNCAPEDFFRGEPVIVRSREHPKARKYLKLPFDCNLVYYGGNVVASVSEETEPIVRTFLSHYPAEACFKTPALHWLDGGLEDYKLRTKHMAEYFLPDISSLKGTDCGFTVKMLGPEQFRELYMLQWSNALCKDRAHLDRIAVGAYDGDTLIGLAGASADCETMWQIGIDVLTAYRGRGVASCLTTRLALEILKLGKVPFYCAAWSNIPSVRNAIRSGFRPAWVELTAKPVLEVEKYNRN